MTGGLYDLPSVPLQLAKSGLVCGDRPGDMCVCVDKTVSYLLVVRLVPSLLDGSVINGSKR